MTKTLEIQEASRKAVEALSKIAQAVGSTLGPAGKPAIIEKRDPLGDFCATYTKDGITVLKALEFNDPIEHAIHYFCNQSSAKTVLDAGDGPQPEYSRVLTPKGFVEMRDIRVGMEICGTNGTIQTVLGVFPKGDKEIYKVQFSDNREIECSSDHLWTVTNIGRTHPRQETKTTSELAEDYLLRKAGGWEQKRYYTPRTVVEFHDNAAEMPLDPYLVGVLLGDGSLSGSGSVEISLGKPKEHVIAKLILPEGFNLYTTFVENKNYFRVKIQGRSKDGKTMQEILGSIGLLGTKSGTKFIPKSYLYSTIANRERLFQGLTDTDGHINARGLVEFSSISKELAQDFVDLCRSLGKTATMREHVRTEGVSYSMTPIWRVTQLVGFKYGNRLDKITATGIKTPMMCIKVSNPDNLYITDNYIVTHNTTSTLVLAASVAQAILSSSSKNPQALARQFKREAEAAITKVEEIAIRDASLLRLVAMTSSNGDSDIASAALEALDNVGAYGTVVIAKDALQNEPYKIIRQNGYCAGRGYEYHKSLAISVSEKSAENDSFTLQSPAVFVYNGNLESIEQITQAVNCVAAQSGGQFKQHLVCFAKDIGEGLANEVMVQNRSLANGKHPGRIFLSKLALSPEMNVEYQRLLDISAITCAAVNDGASYRTATYEDLGVCSSIEVQPHKTIINGRAPKHTIPHRAAQNEKAISFAPTKQGADVISARNAELTGGLVTISVGGGHSASIQERADRVDDAIQAVQAASRDGVVPGAGMSYVYAARASGMSPALSEAFSSVVLQLFENYGSPLTFDLALADTGTTAIRFEENEVLVGDFRELGIADSAVTVTSVIRNGVELGILCATTGCIAVTADLGKINEARMLFQAQARHGGGG